MMMRFFSFARRFREAASGIAIVEFALTLPLLTLLSTTGIEYANYFVTRKQIGEIAAAVADNASRMGAQSSLSNKPVSEAEVNDLFTGASLQGGTRLNLAGNARIILSSLEQNSSGGQWIHWQRCFGAKAHTSTYGTQGDGATGTSFPGMGPSTSRVTASASTAVMFVEIAYTYRPVIGIIPLPLQDMVETASFNVRDDRDLSGVYSSPGVTASTCS